MIKKNLISELASLISENQNPDTLNIDQVSTEEVVKQINQQDHKVAEAIEKIIPEISQTVDVIVNAFNEGGRLIYLGAGTSGRIGILDAVECIPTFGIEHGMVIGIMAGGESAMYQAKEGIEDQFDEGEKDLLSIDLKREDVVVGIAASGRTPYVIGALDYAKQVGAKTVALSCNPKAEIAAHAEIALLPIVGPEALTGSTRMKSGTAQKMVLNILSTASMIRIGKSYHNLMVDVKATNEKLHARGTRMLMQVTGLNEQEARDTLKKAGGLVKLAILMGLTGKNSEEATRLLDNAGGFLRNAIENAKK
ncbi:MAG: N-acetylmuramic acid 6-phosphate etherase [Gammaproteobacteria bacterium]|nr:MAG: N-acetylmuramic acid 6-phosphate etherase [Gammaproteobacteria bacterium]